MEGAVSTTLQKLCCQGCGAILPVEEGIRFLTCNYCQARLEVVRDPATTHTRIIEEIDDRTRRMERKLDAIELRDRLTRLELSWRNYLDQTCTRDPQGNLQMPDSASPVLIGAVSVIGTLVLCSILANDEGGRWLIVVIVPAGLFISWRLFASRAEKFRAFEKERLRYEKVRADLRQRLGEIG